MGEIDFLSAANEFNLKGKAISCLPLGNGHINITRLITDDAGNKYVLQRVNDNIFTDVDALMRNILSVTQYLNRQRPNSSLSFINTKNGASYLRRQDGCFRLYEYVEGISLETASTPEQLATCGRAFGEFQTRLKDFDAAQLSETIPRFHDTVKRLNDLEMAAQNDAAGRLKDVKPEYEFYASRKSEAGKMLDMLKRGELKLRVTHNDTKLNNVLLNPDTLEPVCVIDLDTVMPGLSGNDFGDCIRTGASTAAEDERDTDKVELNLDLYKAFAKGFLSQCGSSLTAAEIDTLPLGAYLMTYECGARFLTDYLNGDTYFHTAYAEHNLVRTRTQIKLVSDTERKWAQIRQIITQEANK